MISDHPVYMWSVISEHVHVTGDFWYTKAIIDIPVSERHDWNRKRCFQALLANLATRHKKVRDIAHRIETPHKSSVLPPTHGGSPPGPIRSLRSFDFSFPGKVGFFGDDVLSSRSLTGMWMIILVYQKSPVIGDF